MHQKQGTSLFPLNQGKHQVLFPLMHLKTDANNKSHKQFFRRADQAHSWAQHLVPTGGSEHINTQDRAFPDK